MNIHYHRDSKVFNTMGYVASTIGGFLLGEGDERGVGMAFSGLAVTCGFGFVDDSFVSAKLDLSERKLLFIRNFCDRSKASAISVAAGASIRGMKNIFSGVYTRDLRRIGKGGLQYAIGGMGLYANAHMPSSVAAAINYSALASYHTLCRGIKEFANGQKLSGGASIFFGTSGVIGSCIMAYNALHPVLSMSQVVPRIV